MPFVGSMSITIDKLMIWRAGTWSKHEYRAANLTLRLNYDQLLITSDTKVVESLNMNKKIKGIYKDDIFILIVNDLGQIRKMKFQIKSNLAQCLQVLGQLFPVINHNALQSKDIVSSRYRNIEEVLKCAVEKIEVRDDSDIPLRMPTEYTNFVKLCLLDPMFPQLVLETQKVLENDILKK